jgi:hypothetical protein
LALRAFTLALPHSQRQIWLHRRRLPKHQLDSSLEVASATSAGNLLGMRLGTPQCLASLEVPKGKTSGLASEQT